MSCKPSKTLIWLLCVSFAATGCTPTKPMYLNETGNLSYYLEQATQIEYPDIETASLDEVTQANVPMTVMDPEFSTYEDMTLEDAVSYALQNSKVLRGYGTPGLQGTRVSPGVDNLANGPTAAGTIYNVAVRETEPGFLGTAGQLSSPSSLTTNTGLDGNQGVEAALADFDAQFTSSLNWSKNDQPRNTFSPTNDQIQFFQQDQVQWQSEVAKKSANGTQIFFRNVNTYTANNNPSLGDVSNASQALESFYRTALEAEIRQPLLRGRGTFINRMPIVISRIGTDQELANLEAQLQNTVTNVEIRYWDLYCSYRNLDAAKTGRDAALETWRIVKDQFDEGADVNIQQVAQASEQYHFFDAQVIDAYNNLLNAEGAVRFLLGWSSTDCRMIRPIDEPVMAPVEFDWCTSLCESLTYRPELRQERWEIKKRELALAYAKNGLLPELNATALYRVLGFGNKFGASGEDQNFPAGESSLTSPGESGALNSLYEGNFQELQLGLTFGMPVGFRRELANVRNAQLKLAREIARIEDMELDVTRELSEAMRALAANQMIMRSSFNRWKDTSIEEKHFETLKDEGVETLDVALDAQRRRSQAEIAFYTALCEYNKVIALIHRRKGTTLAYSGIEFSEGAWTGKAYMDSEENARRRSAGRELNYGWTRPQVISRGENWPTGGNDGATIPGDLSTENVIYDEGIAPLPYDQEMSAPAGGEIYNGPYYDSYQGGEVIQQQPMYEGAPAPTLAPANERPIPMGSSSRVHRDTDVRQVAYEQPSQREQKRKRSKARSRSTASGQARQQVRLSATTSTKTRNTAGRSNGTKVKSTKPKADQATRPAKRLKAKTPANNTAKTQAKPAAAPQSNNMDAKWDRMGLKRPSSGNGTVATIKINGSTETVKNQLR